MPEPPPRKRFQIHLSTAIVMMFVAGALMWAIIIPEGQAVWQYDVLQDPDAPDINLFPRGFTTVLFFGVAVVVCLRLEQPEAIPNKKRTVVTRRKFITNCLVFVGK